MYREYLYIQSEMFANVSDNIECIYVKKLINFTTNLISQMFANVTDNNILA